MKKMKYLLLFVLLFFSRFSFSQDFYDVETVNTIEIIFSEPNWDEILDQLYFAGNEERLVGTAIINGVQFDSVGVRYKGNSSYSPNKVKNPLNIKLDYVLEDQKLGEYGTLKLANLFKDPSFVREVLSYEMCHKYMPASKSNFSNVYINGDLIGLYSSVQDVDKYFMRTHFGSDENACFKGELQGGGPQPVKVWGYFGTDSTSYFNYYQLESDNGWNELINFLDTLNNYTSDVEEVLNIDRHLWMLAYDILMINLDAPVNFGHNYYLYKDNSGQFNPIVWDLNENFGGFSNVLGGQPLNVYQMQHLTPFFNISNPNYPIINKILPNPEYQKIYIAHVKTIINENFANGLYLDRALEIQEIIDDDVQSDPNKFYSYSDFLNNINNSVGFGPQAVVGITQLMETRIDYLMNHNAFQGVQPVITDVTYSPAIVYPGTTVWINAEVSEAGIVELGYRFKGIDRFEKIQMFDDGNHNDGTAGDGLYGVSVITGNFDVEYYIYAKNDEAVMFSPERAEYEFYSIPVINPVYDLRINEFMAANESTIADPQGEYDDWIEIYNSGAEAVDIGGMYITDDLNDPDKYQIPSTQPDSTTVAPGEYLLLWADKDSEDGVLHLEIKLSASGEQIGLFSYDGETPVDTVTFGQQDTDISFGRYPDGNEYWVFMTIPTPGASNIFESNVQIIQIPAGWSGISAFVEPEDPDMGTVLAPVLDNMVICQHFSQVYWPEQGIYTLNAWDSFTGYSVKLSEETNLTISGSFIDEPVVDLDAGWNYLPVLFPAFIDPVEFFSELVNDEILIIVQEIGGCGIYWPEWGISTLEYLEPGAAYFINLTEAVTVSFEDLALNNSSSSLSSSSLKRYFKNEIIQTGSSHIIAIDKNSGTMPGDVLSVFTENGLCAGTVVITENDSNSALVVFGDDSTTSAVDGFSNGEPMTFKLIRDNKEYSLEITFDDSLNNSGLFSDKGLSAITNIMLNTGTVNSPNQELIKIFPNPSEGKMFLKGDYQSIEISVFNTCGQPVFSGKVNNGILDLSRLPKGIYFVKFIDFENNRVGKIIIR